MAPIKFEENIKDKLEQRTLKPSPDAWSKLSDRLDAEPKERTNKTYWWLGIAASFVGLLIVATIFFSENPSENISTPVLVEEETKDPVEENYKIEDAVVEGQKTPENQQKTQENQVVEEDTKIDHVKTETPVLKLNKSVVNNKDKAIVFQQEDTVKEEDIETVVDQGTAVAANINDSVALEAIKVDQVVKQIQQLQKEKSSVTNAEIDALLHQAEKELMTERFYNESTKTVDAELLLLQVETDLDQSFRDRVFEALKLSYTKVKTAVAERNN